MVQKIQHPNKIVSVELIKFLRAIFKQNYEAGNWHMDPKTQMYIREDYPEDDKERGIKPGFVVSEYGSVNKGVDYLSKVGYDPMEMRGLLNGHTNEEVFSGRFSVSGVSEAQDEAQSLAYLALISIDQFIGHLVGKRGIHFINALNYTKPQPFKKSSRYNLWESKIPIDYAISKVYTFRDNIGSPKFTGVDIEFKGDTDSEGVEDTGVNVDKVTSNNQEAHQDPQVEVGQEPDNSSTEYDSPGVEVKKEGDTDSEGVEDVGVNVDRVTSTNQEAHQDPQVEVGQETDESSTEYDSPGIEVKQEEPTNKEAYQDIEVRVIQKTGNNREEFLRAGTIIEQPSTSNVKPFEVKIIRSKGYNFSSIKEFYIEDLTVEEELEIKLEDLPVSGVLSTVYLEAEDDVTLEIYEGDMLEYRSQKETLIYDIPDLLYTEELTAVIKADESIDISVLRIRVLEF